MLQITHIGGVKVVEQDVAVGPHPRWRDQEAVYRGIAYVLLENGESGFACETCGYMREKIASVASHLNAHNDSNKEPVYPLETLKALLRSVKRAKQAGGRDYCARAAADLNRRGIKTMDETPWRAEQVSRLFKHWDGRIKAPLPPTMTPPPAQRTGSSYESRQKAVVAERAATFVATTDPLVKRLIELGERLQTLSQDVETIVPEVAIALAEGKIDPETVAKAAKWDAIDPAVFAKADKFDQFQQLMGK